MNNDMSKKSIAEDEFSVIKVMKQLLPDPVQKIKLEDFVTKYLNAYTEATSLIHFPVQGPAVTKEEFITRIKKYNAISSDLQIIVALLSHWGTKNQLVLLDKICGHIGRTDKGSAGTVFWLKLGWYPVMLLMYVGGIAALARSNYDALKIILEVGIRVGYENDGKRTALVIPTMGKMMSLNDAFKWFPGRERNHTPRSEYLFELLKNGLNETLFLGLSYEEIFDQYECLQALVFADQGSTDWGPIGRFGWKYASPVSANNPFQELIEDAKRYGENWLPIRSGLFGGSQKRFEEIAESFQKHLKNVAWI